MARMAIREFSIANPMYRGGTVYAYTVAGGVKTAILATLYAAETGTAQLANPQKLDSLGKWRQAVYIDAAVILTVSGLSVPSHDTGIVFYAPGADFPYGKLGVSGDNGDANKTLTVGDDDVVQRWNTPLTASRDAILANASAFEGARFRICRESGATGNLFDLSVKREDGTVLAVLTNSGQWAEVDRDAASLWRLTAAGSL